MNQPATCYCGCDFTVHRDGATSCATCTTCPGYVEHAEVLLTLDALNDDDRANGRRRDNRTTAHQLELRRAHRNGGNAA